MRQTQRLGVFLGQSLSILLLLLLGCHGYSIYEGGREDDSVVAVVNDTSRAGEVTPETRPLTCHQCYLSVDGDRCLEFGFEGVHQQTCETDQPFCEVEKYLVDDKLVTFSRGCSSHCRDGCESTGSLLKVEYCWSCCSNNYCNTGSGAPGQASTAPHWTLLAFSLLLLAS